MPATTIARPARTTPPSSRPAHAGRGERAIVRAGAALLALHVVDDTLIHPPAGTPASDHLISAAVPVALLALAAWAYPRLPGMARGTLALVLGLLAVVGGGEAAYYGSKVGLSGDDFTGLLALAA